MTSVPSRSRRAAVYENAIRRTRNVTSTADGARPEPHERNRTDRHEAYLPPGGVGVDWPGTGVPTDAFHASMVCDGGTVRCEFWTAGHQRPMNKDAPAVLRSHGGVRETARSHRPERALPWRGCCGKIHHAVIASASDGFPGDSLLRRQIHPRGICLLSRYRVVSVTGSSSRALRPERIYPGRRCSEQDRGVVASALISRERRRFDDSDGTERGRQKGRHPMPWGWRPELPTHDRRIGAAGWMPG